MIGTTCAPCAPTLPGAPTGGQAQPETGAVTSAGSGAAATVHPSTDAAAARAGAPQRGGNGHVNRIDVAGFAAVLASSGAIASAVDDAPAVSTDTSPDDSSEPSALPDQLFALLPGWPVPPSAGSMPATPPAVTSSILLSMPSTATSGSAPLRLSPEESGVFSFPGLRGATDSIPASSALMPPALAMPGAVEEVVLQSADAASSLETLVPTVATALAPAARTAPAMASAAVPMPVQPDAGFDDGFGARVAWMAEQRLGHAEIRLNPEHLGPIEVRVHLEGTRVSAEFHSVHAEVRQAIEASVPRLRELLGQHGLQLGQADVGKQHSGQGPSTPLHPVGPRDEHEPPALEPAAIRARTRGLLDEYA